MKKGLKIPESHTYSTIDLMLSPILLVIFLLFSQTLGFTPTVPTLINYSSIRYHVTIPKTRFNLFTLSLSRASTSPSTLTPTGFGFSSPLHRIITNASQKLPEGKSYGFVRVLDSDSVDEVMGKVYTQCTGEVGGYVALVFNPQEEIVGIFTDRDYLEFTKSRDASASLATISTPISSLMTPKEKLIIASAGISAGEALRVMELNKFRHLVVGESDEITYRVGGRVLTSGGIRAVVSMADLMKQVQVDERLSLSKLKEKVIAASEANCK